jgi:hypothetical protein
MRHTQRGIVLQSSKLTLKRWQCWHASTDDGPPSSFGVLYAQQCCSVTRKLRQSDLSQLHMLLIWEATALQQFHLLAISTHTHIHTHTPPPCALCDLTCSAAAAAACADATCCISWASRSVRDPSSSACIRASAEPTAGAVLARHVARSAVVIGACSSSGNLKRRLCFAAALLEAKQHVAQLQDSNASQAARSDSMNRTQHQRWLHLCCGVVLQLLVWAAVLRHSHA